MLQYTGNRPGGRKEYSPGGEMMTRDYSPSGEKRRQRRDFSPGGERGRRDYSPTEQSRRRDYFPTEERRRMNYFPSGGEGNTPSRRQFGGSCAGEESLTLQVYSSDVGKIIGKFWLVSVFLLSQTVPAASFLITSDRNW